MNDALRRELEELIPLLEQTPEHEDEWQLIMRLTRLAQARAALAGVRRRSAAA